MLVVLLLLILLNGVFAMAEIALVTASQSRLQAMSQRGELGATTAWNLSRQPTRLLSAIQIGITSIGVLNGIVGEASFAPSLAQFFTSWGIPSAYAFSTATAIVVAAITFVTIVLGELVPKRIGQLHPELISRILAPALHALSIAALPFVSLLAISTRAIVRLLGIKRAEQKKLSREEIHATIDELSTSSSLDPSQRKMLHNVFHLEDRQLGSIMIPRPDVILVDLQLSTEENLRNIVESGHSHFPVCDGSLDNIKGVLRSSQILVSTLRNDAIDFSANLTPPAFVPETISGADLIDEFRRNRQQILFVIDEFGDVQGLVTLHDVMQAITGEMSPPHPDHGPAIPREDGSWLLDAALPLSEVGSILNIASFPDADKHRYHTLAGLVIFLMNRIPTTGDRTELANWTLEVVDMDGRRIDKILASPRLPTSSD